MQIMSQAWLVGAVSAALLAPAAQAGGLRSLRSAGAVDQAAADAAMDAELAVGAGPTDARIARLEAELNATFTALPKDDEGGLGHQAVRYALHRLFVQRHGWYVKGLEPGTSSPGADGWVPSYLEGRLRSHLSGKGAALRDLALFAAAIEDLVTREAAGMMRATYEMLELPTGGNLTQEEAQQLVSTFFVAFLRAGNFSASSPGDALAKVGVFQRKYKGWSEASDWLRGAVATVAGSSSLEGGLDLAGAERLAVEIGERYHAFNDMECKALKTEMEGLQVHKAGRVRLPHFYRKGLYSHWEFNEKASYLRTLGALDESEEGNTMVIMPNYLMARTNCLEATNMYALCCRNECEDLMDQLEVDVAAPEAEPKRLAELVAAMPSDTVAAPRNLSAALLSRLEEVAASNGGKVPLHGRLFAQWMHHAYPRECEYPHLAGKTSPLDVYDMEQAGGEILVTPGEMQSRASAKRRKTAPVESVPWVHREELLGAQGAMDSQVPPLFLPFHALVFACTGAGLAWLARLVPRGAPSRKSAETFLPPSIV